jgi:hypothetical protein
MLPYSVVYRSYLLTAYYNVFSIISMGTEIYIFFWSLFIDQWRKLSCEGLEMNIFFEGFEGRLVTGSIEDLNDCCD